MEEFEIKIPLTKGEYQTLLYGLCKNSQIVKQANYYFDTEDFSMNKKGITYRIRSKNGEFKATVKTHIKEKNYSIEEVLSVGNEFDSSVFRPFGVLLQGVLTTRRILVCKTENCEAVIDCNTYLGTVDYELEIEYKKGQKKEAKKILKGIADFLVSEKAVISKDEFSNRTGNSKSERFFKKIKKISANPDIGCQD